MSAKIAVVSMAEIAAQPGAPLSADYWVNRRPGQSYEQYRRQARATSHLGAARKHLARANRSLELAADQLEAGI